jgi:hypothetical protein
MTAISSFPARPRLTRLGLRAMAIAVVVTVPGVFATTTTASAAPAPSVAPARSVAPIDDPIAESAQTALDLAIRDVDSGGVPSATYLVARALVADQVGARLWTPGHLFNEAWGRASNRAVVGTLTARCSISAQCVEPRSRIRLFGSHVVRMVRGRLHPSPELDGANSHGRTAHDRYSTGR